ncbi:MAG: GNAT family N-acetyltransferase [Flavobacteriaceae bacterium]|nr:GNAT family N-acetyltransferase [Flavobacteriaceae bacterium]
MNLYYKKCTQKDINELIEISRSTFIAAFEKQNNRDDFSAYMTAAFSEETIKKQLQNPDSLFYFIYSDDVLVGYFKLNENNAQNELFSLPSVELERLYISSDYQGKEIGKNALRKTLEIAAAKSVSFLWLGVWEHNHAAIRFYERHGFVKFGTHPYLLGNDEQTDWLMKYELS